MTTIADLRSKWEARRVEHARLGSLVPFAAICAEVLADLRELTDDDTLTLKEAGLLSGYSTDHLQRLVARGVIQNHGAKGRPRIRREDVPRKAGHGSVALPSTAPHDQLSARRRIVADAQAHTGA